MERLHHACSQITQLLWVCPHCCLHLLSTFHEVKGECDSRKPVWVAHHSQAVWVAQHLPIVKEGSNVERLHH